jgi:hypothetical protein
MKIRLLPLCKIHIQISSFPTFLDVSKFVCRLSRARITRTTCISLSKWYRKKFKNRFKRTITIYMENVFAKTTRGGGGDWRGPNIELGQW